MIKINGKKYPYKFGMSVLKRVGQDLGKETISDLVETFSSKDYENLTMDDLDDVSSLLFHAINRGCEVQGTEFPLTKDDVLDAVYDDPKSFGDMMNSFSDSLGGDGGNPEAPQKGGKK